MSIGRRRYNTPRESRRDVLLTSFVRRASPSRRHAIRPARCAKCPMVDTAARLASTTGRRFRCAPSKERDQKVRVARVYGRQPNWVTVECIVVTAILELFADAPADFESVVRRHGDGNHDRTACGCPRAEQDSVWDEVHPTDGVGLDVRRLKAPEASVLRKKSAAPVVREKSRAERLPSTASGYPGASSSMSDSHDLDAIESLAKHDREREPVQEVSACPTQVGRPSARPLFDPFDRRIELRHEGISRIGVPVLVPVSRGVRFADCLWMEPDRLGRHYRPRIMRRASDHGTAATAPESNSRETLAISSAQGSFGALIDFLVEALQQRCCEGSPCCG